MISLAFRESGSIKNIPVSIVRSTYSDLSLISESVEGAAKQEGRDINLIIIHDDSVHDFEEVLKDMKASDSTTVLEHLKIKSKPLWIFDIDGTLFDISHRLHYLESELDDKWDRFYNACDFDVPFYNIISILESLKAGAADIWFLTGRSESIRGKTIDQLVKYTSFTKGELEDILVMRELGDYSKDCDLKQSMLDSMLPEDVFRIGGVFEDRARVVKMWRSNDIPCLQVSEGNF